MERRLALPAFLLLLPLTMAASDLSDLGLDLGGAGDLTVKFGDGAAVTKGASVPLADCSSRPEVEWDADDDALYTLLMVDPDAPSRADPKAKYW